MDMQGILARSAIVDAMDSRKFVVTPLDDEMLQPASVDLRLGDTFLAIDWDMVPQLPTYDLGAIPLHSVKADSYVLRPGAFCLARTEQQIFVDQSLSAFVEGRSSVGRGGLFIQNAGWVDPGFSGSITLELFNATPFFMRLHAHQRIAQLVLASVCGISGGYHGKYQGQLDPVASKLNLDIEVQNGRG